MLYTELKQPPNTDLCKTNVLLFAEREKPYLLFLFNRAFVLNVSGFFPIYTFNAKNIDQCVTNL